MHEKKTNNCFSLFKPLSLGFSLIELLVTVTVIMILTGGAIAGYMRFAEKRAVFTAAEEVQQWYRIAQQKTSVKEVNCATSSDFGGYRIVFSGSTFTRTENCGGSYENDVSYTVPSGVTVSSPANNTAVLFKPLQQGTNLGSTTVTVTLTKGTTSYSFTINPQGAISDVK